MKRKADHDERGLTPDTCALIMVDYQTDFIATINPLERGNLIENAVSLAKTAKAFAVPTVLTTIGENRDGGRLLPEIQLLFPKRQPFKRFILSMWGDRRVGLAIRKSGRKKLVMAGLWTDFGFAPSVTQALKNGYEVYVVSDACADLNAMAHEMSIHRMVEAGAVPIKRLELFLDLSAGDETVMARVQQEFEMGGQLLMA